MTVFRANRVTIHISSDEMSALLSVSAKGSDFPPMYEIEAALKEAGVISGIEKEILRKIQKQKGTVHEMLIAKGVDVVKNEPDTINWSLDIADKNRPKINIDGKADYKKLQQFMAVNKDDEILTITRGQTGVPGMTVTGHKIPIPTGDKPLKMPAGKNTRISSDGLTLYANIDGVAMLKEGEVVIDNVYHIHGDVDFNTGNVKYNGTVMIDGDVRSGFRVEATDSIYVHGSVEAAEIYSKNGSIVIKNGVLGRNRARILAGDDLNCGFMQDTIASVKNDVIIKHYAINSNITSGGKIIVTENEGLIRGGKAVAEKGIELLVAGSERNILTEMVLTRSDMGEEQSKLWHAKIRLAEEYQALDTLRKRFEFLELLRKRLSSISVEREKELSKLKRDIKKTEARVEDIRVATEELTKEMMNQSPEQAVRIRERLYRKVTVTIGHKKYFSTSMKGRVNIYRKDDELIIEPMT